MGDISFFINLPPKPLARPRAAYNKHMGRVHVYDSPAQKLYNKKMFDALVPFAPEEPLEGPLAIEVVACLPIPSSWPKADREGASSGLCPHIKKPDLDNFIKNILDRLTDAHFWVDDSQLIAVKAMKFYSDIPGWHITIRQAGGDYDEAA